MRSFVWGDIHERAVSLVFEGRLNAGGIAQELGINRRTLTRWKHRMEFAQGLAAKYEEREQKWESEYIEEYVARYRAEQKAKEREWIKESQLKKRKRAKRPRKPAACRNYEGGSF